MGMEDPSFLAGGAEMVLDRMSEESDGYSILLSYLPELESEQYMTNAAVGVMFSNCGILYERSPMITKRIDFLRAGLYNRHQNV